MSLFDVCLWYLFDLFVSADLLFCCLCFVVFDCTAVENSDRIGLNGSINHRKFFHRRPGDVCKTDSRYWSWGLNKFPRFNERNISGELNT